MRIALAQMKVYPAQPQKNLKTMLNLIAKAKQDQIDLIVFPEASVSGLLLGKYLRNDSFLKDCLLCNHLLAEAADGIAVIFGNIVKGSDGLKNGCFLADNGQVREIMAAMGGEMIAGSYAGFTKEPAPGGIGVRLAGEFYRIGCLFGDWRGKLMPFNRGDVDLMINFASLPLRLDEKFHAEKIAQATGCPLIFINACGLQNTGKANYLLKGGSAYFDETGELQAQAPLLEEKLIIVEDGKGEIRNWPQGEELIFTALVQGVKEFASAIGVKKAVIGLSGGIDSALSACIYVKALGRENVLLCNMPSRFNSSLTKNYAKELAYALKTHYTTMSLENSLNLTKAQFANTSVINTHEEKEWNLEIDSFCEENLQARDRSARILATVAASWGAIFPCNGNKAEATVGYATFYGDLAGAFAAICDLWKHQVYAAANYAGTVFPEADAVLKGIASLKPSAELSENQDIEKGKGDPLNYAYHDYLLASWVEKESTPFDILELYRGGVLEEFLECPAGIVKRCFADAESFIMDLEYWWDMYKGISVAKRIQAPPLLILSRHPLSEGVECQLPPYFGEDYNKLRDEILREDLNKR